MQTSVGTCSLAINGKVCSVHLGWWRYVRKRPAKLPLTRLQSSIEFHCSSFKPDTGGARTANTKMSVELIAPMITVLPIKGYRLRASCSYRTRTIQHCCGRQPFAYRPAFLASCSGGMSEDRLTRVGLYTANSAASRILLYVSSVFV